MRKAKIIAALGAAMLLAVSGRVAAAACDRDCLLKLADDYLQALTGKDHSRVPFAANARIVENAKRIKPGEGLWQTITAGPTGYKVVVPDAVSQQVGGIVMMQAEGKPAQIGFRLELENGKITEAEHLIALPREQSLANLEKLRPALLLKVPYEYADSRGRLIHIAKSYYDALDDNNGNLAPFASDCDRLENGMRTAPSGGPSLSGPSVPGTAARPASLLGMQDCTSQINSQTFRYIDRIDNRRVEIADEETGLVLGLSHFRHAMQQKEFPILNDPSRTTTTMNFNPFDLPALHVYKIWGGQIHEIEAMGFMAPYNAPTGWE